MMSKRAGQTLPVITLKRSFESAVRDIYEVGLTGKISQSRTPIVQRAGTTLLESSASAQRRALSDAAKALAQLWKVAPNSGRW